MAKKKFKPVVPVVNGEPVAPKETDKREFVWSGRVTEPVTCYEVESQQKVKAMRVTAEGKHEFVMPDHLDDKGEPVGHGSSVSVSKGDYLVIRPDGPNGADCTVFGVLADDFAKRFAPNPAVKV